jgi:hypothetical protein
MEITKPKTRVRKRPLDLQLQAALNDAAEASNADASTRILINSRLTILHHRLNKQENGKLSKALMEIERVKAEVTHLQAELAARSVSVSPADDIRAVLKNMENQNA